MTGLPLIITFVIAIIVMIVSISKFKIHPFLSIMGISLILALVVGIPLETIPKTIGTGFSSIFTGIGLVIILGTLIGLILERTGAAIRLSDGILKVVGPRHPQLAMMIIGWIVSIPVFCDSGFVIVNPIRKSLCKKTKASSVALTMALAGGLYASHVFIPPTPGPIAAAGMVGLENNLLLVIAAGVAVSVPCLIAAYFFASYIGKRVKSDEEMDDDKETYEALLKQYGKLPSFFASLLPILMPILLMAIGSVASVVPMNDFINQLCVFLGKPVIALTAGLLCAIPLLAFTHKTKQLYDITQDTLKTAGPIIFITAAGSVLGQVIVEAGFVQSCSPPFVCRYILPVPDCRNSEIISGILDSGNHHHRRYYGYVFILIFNDVCTRNDNTSLCRHGCNGYRGRCNDRISRK